MTSVTLCTWTVSSFLHTHHPPGTPANLRSRRSPFLWTPPGLAAQLHKGLPLAPGSPAAGSAAREGAGEERHEVTDRGRGGGGSAAGTTDTSS